MDEHPIRLRGGWEIVAPEPGRLTLPSTQLPQTSCRLVRRFQRPPLGPEGESLWLRLERVPGLRSIQLNGTIIAIGPFEPGSLLLPLDDLPPRNELALDVELRNEAADEPWGEIALLVRRMT